ncbi:MAG: hypothetical protein QW838_04130 [Candidatus Nitrosotenuis sp.]
MTTSGEFEAYVRGRFGALSAGKHAPDEGAACVLEAVSAWLGLEWTDDPDTLGLPDIRPLNDASWSSAEARTGAMTRLIAAIWDFREWPRARRAHMARRVALRTAREVLPFLLRALGHADLAEGLARARTLGAAMSAREVSTTLREIYRPYTSAATPEATNAIDAAYVTFASVRSAFDPHQSRKALTNAARAAEYAASSISAARGVAATAQASADALLRAAVDIWIEEAQTEP